MPQVSETLQAVVQQLERPSPTNSPAGRAATSSTPLPSESVERLFARLLGMYGNRFTAMWEVCDAAVVKAEWAEGLAGFRRPDIERGLRACLEGLDWPPTLPQFRALCRPRMDYEALYRQAANGQLSNPLLYWAAMRFGQSDLRSLPYLGEARSRWVAIVTELRDANLPPVPEHEPVALPAPGKTFTPEKAASAVASMRALLGAGSAA